jgi:restriction system protein
LTCDTRTQVELARWSTVLTEKSSRYLLGEGQDVSRIVSKIVLIDGSRLAELMIEFGVAVAKDATYTVKRIGDDFFESI